MRLLTRGTDVVLKDEHGAQGTYRRAATDDGIPMFRSMYPNLLVVAKFVLPSPREVLAGVTGSRQTSARPEKILRAATAGPLVPFEQPDHRASCGARVRRLARLGKSSALHQISQLSQVEETGFGSAGRVASMPGIDPEAEVSFANVALLERTHKPDQIGLLEFTQRAFCASLAKARSVRDAMRWPSVWPADAFNHLAVHTSLTDHPAP